MEKTLVSNCCEVEPNNQIEILFGICPCCEEECEYIEVELPEVMDKEYFSKNDNWLNDKPDLTNQIKMF